MFECGPGPHSKIWLVLALGVGVAPASDPCGARDEIRSPHGMSLSQPLSWDLSLSLHTLCCSFMVPGLAGCAAGRKLK